VRVEKQSPETSSPGCLLSPRISSKQASETGESSAMDDLLDLDFASSHKPQAATKPNPQASYGSARTAFDYLAAPSRQAAAPPIRPVAPQSAPKPPTKPAAAGGDAFAELFGASSSPSSSGAATARNGLSMAERLQQDSSAKLAAYGSSASRSGASSPFDSLGTPPAAASPQSRTACVVYRAVFPNSTTANGAGGSDSCMYT
jgi:hypothetical protein